MSLYSMLKECVNTNYLQVGVSANYATRVEGQTLYIFFESSKGIEDWKSNFNFPAKAYKRMNKTIWFAHRGYLKMWKEIEEYLAPIIADKKLNKIIIVGYSIGGAIAMLCHEYVWFNRKDLRENLEGYAFGTPRVFWGIKTKAISKRWQNFLVIRNLDDIVTHLPPFIFGFKHVGKMLKIGKRDKYSPIQAHFYENYLAELEDYEKSKE